MDDIIVKSKKKESAPDDLRQVFDRIRKIEMKFNPKKCTFEVLSGKCLGYLVRRIEANPMKIKAIQDILDLRTVKKV